MAPGIDIEMSDDERLWEATSEYQWSELTSVLGQKSSLSSRQTLNHLISRSTTDEAVIAIDRSPFSSTVIMHALHIHIWHLAQCAQNFSQNQDDIIASNLRAGLLTQAETALDRCNETFLGALDSNSESHMRLNELAVSQRSNCIALLRTAYVRMASANTHFDRVSALGMDPALHPRPQLKAYVQTWQHRGPFVTKAARWAYHGFQTSVKAGHLLVRKTAAFKWSLDHAIADWDCSKFFSSS